VVVVVVDVDRSTSVYRVVFRDVFVDQLVLYEEEYVVFLDVVKSVLLEVACDLGEYVL